MFDDYGNCFGDYGSCLGNYGGCLEDLVVLERGISSTSSWAYLKLYVSSSFLLLAPSWLLCGVLGPSATRLVVVET
jgi:hypothetical protein